MAQRRNVADFGPDQGEDLVNRPGTGGVRPPGGPGQIGLPPNEGRMPIPEDGPLDRSNTDGPHGPGEVDPTGQSGENPRERGEYGTGIGGNATLRRPSVPTPGAGSSQLIPFSPMGDTSAQVMARPRGPGALFGALGGLQGGGLGVPQSGESNAPNQDITGLIRLLTSMRGGQ
jgi:hypothetical protein